LSEAQTKSSGWAAHAVVRHSSAIFLGSVPGIAFLTAMRTPSTFLMNILWGVSLTFNVPKGLRFSFFWDSPF
jgi:hypothetical protein